MIKPYPPSREATGLLNRESAEKLRREVEAEVKAESETKPEPPLPPGMISEAEARKILLENAMKAGDQKTVLAIQQEDEPTFHLRWDRYIEELRAEKVKKEKAARGPSGETRKALRGKRKKKKK